MIAEFVAKWDAKKNEIEDYFKEKHPTDYAEIVKKVVEILKEDYGSPNAEKIHEIDDGAYQGTLLFIIPEDTYQPHDYWYVRVWYGSCSGCDTLEGIRGYYDEKPTEQQTKDYMTLALHILQGITKMGGEPA